VPTAEENMAAQLAKAAEWRALGREDRAATAEAAADRYKRISEAGSKIETASKNIAAIKDKLKASQNAASGPVTSGPNKGWYQTTTSRPSSACPSGHERVRITYMDGVETNVESLGCHGGEKVVKDDPIELTSSLIQETKVTPTPPTPTPTPTPITPPRPPAKTAPIDTVLFNDDSISPEIMIDLVFEDIGGHELLSISRNDIINGQRVSYSPIKNLGLIQQTYNPNNLFSLQKTSDKYFANFAIKFDEKVPQEGSGENGVNVYIEEETGDLIIETVNMNNDEQVESEIAINGTIYEVNFGETVS
jgi:hypothetical protein